MRKVVGIGEVLLDILFRNGQPTAAVPGGSAFNTLVSLARMGIPTEFISETGQDRVGQIIIDHMQANGMDTRYVSRFPDGQSAVSLAFLNEAADASYLFYKAYPEKRLDGPFPQLYEDDVLLIGSYYALNPQLRPKLLELIHYARERKVLVYYDPNFRAVHQGQALRLTPTLIENLEFADIVRGSTDDFFYLYGLRDAEQIYKEKIRFYCPHFFCTDGGREVVLRTPMVAKSYAVAPVETVSTIGAGDNFNAGLIYGLLKHDIRRHDLDRMDEARWDKVVSYALAFAADVCRHEGNAVSDAFVATHRP